MKNYYLEAAQHIERSFDPGTGKHEYACNALSFVISNTDTKIRHKELFAKYFKPIKTGPSVAWFGAADGYMYLRTPKNVARLAKNKERRVLAMLFMHEITKGDYV